MTVLGAHLDNLDQPAESSYRKLVLMRAGVVGTMWTDGTRHRRPVYERLRDELDDPLFHVRVGPSGRCTVEQWLRDAEAALAELPPGARARVRALNEVNLEAEGGWPPESYADFLIAVRAAWPRDVPLVASPLSLADPAWPTWWSRFFTACGGQLPTDLAAVNCYAHLADQPLPFPRPFDVTELNTLALPPGPARAAWLRETATRLAADTTQIFIAGGRSHGAWDERYVLTEEECARLGAG
jgi:hypothetical protein